MFKKFTNKRPTVKPVVVQYQTPTWLSFGCSRSMSPMIPQINPGTHMAPMIPQINPGAHMKLIFRIWSSPYSWDPDFRPRA